MTWCDPYLARIPGLDPGTTAAGIFGFVEVFRLVELGFRHRITIQLLSV
jgi:hypothetical protein